MFIFIYITKINLAPHKYKTLEDWLFIFSILEWLTWRNKYALGFPGGKESTCQCRRHKRCGFDSWVRKIPWNRKWQLMPVFLPGKFRRQRSLVGYSPWDRKESNMTDKQQPGAHTMLWHYKFSNFMAKYWFKFYIFPLSPN